MKKIIISILLCLAMLISTTSVFASETSNDHISIGKLNIAQNGDISWDNESQNEEENTYTVDFYNEAGEKYAIQGGTSVKLSEVNEELKLGLQLDKIETVTFSNEELVAVKKELFGNDWTLVSLAPFSSNEYLDVTYHNGNTVSIQVLDESTNNTVNVKVDKTGTLIEGSTNRYEVVLDVEGNKEAQTTTPIFDVIMILDTTTSLNNSKFAALKAAAKKMVNDLIGTTNSTNRVAFVQFGDEDKSKILNSKTKNNSYFYTNDTLKGANDTIDGLSNDSDHTGIMFGELLAQKIVNSNECAGHHVVIVMLSDGKPNLSYKISRASLDNKDLKNYYTIHYKSSKNNGGSDDTNFNDDNISNIDDFISSDIKYWDRGDNKPKWTDNITTDNSIHILNENYVKWINDQTGEIPSNYYSGQRILGMKQITLLEGCILRHNSRVDAVYTIGYSNEKELLTKIAGSADHYFYADDGTKIGAAFSQITEKIKLLIQNATVVDYMGTEVDLELKDVSTTGGKPTITNNLTKFQAGEYDIYYNHYIEGDGSIVYKNTDEENETITWNIGDVKYGEKYVLRYRVVRPTREGEDPQETGEDVQLNKQAILSYTDPNNPGAGIQTEKFPVPEYYHYQYYATPNGGGTVYLNSETKEKAKDSKLETVEKITELQKKIHPDKTQNNPVGATAIANEGYDFLGWFADPEGKTKLTENITFTPPLETTSGSTVIGGGKYYALFAKKKYQLTYLVNNDINDKASKTVRLESGTTIGDYTPERTGYTFSGWYTDETYQTKMETGAKMPENNYTLYGKLVQDTASLTIKKEGMGENERAVFVVTGKGIESGLEVVVDGKNGSETINGVFVNESYSIKEKTDWSWRYSSTMFEKTVIISSSVNNICEFENINKSLPWLNGEFRRQNIFGNLETKK